MLELFYIVVASLPQTKLRKLKSSTLKAVAVSFSATEAQSIFQKFLLSHTEGAVVSNTAISEGKARP